MRRCVSLALTLSIVLGLTLADLADLPVGTPLSAGTGVSGVGPFASGPGLVTAKGREDQRGERRHARKQKDGKADGQQRKDRKRQDHRQKRGDRKGNRHNKANGPARERRGRDDARQEGKRAGVASRAQNQGQPRELTSGRLPAAETVAAPGGALSARDRYIVILDDTATNAFDVAMAVGTEAPGVVPTHVYSHVFQGFAAVIPDQALAAVRRNPHVKDVIPDQIVRSGAQIVPTGIDRTDADVNPAAKIDGIDERIDIDVAVIDTAGFADHPDVNEWAWANCTDSPNNSDDQGHGTHVGGTIGALDNEIGVVGVAPGARLWNIRVLTADPEGGSSGLESWILCGLDLVRQYATPQPDGLGDIEVANASLGRTGNDSNCQTQVDAYHWAYCRLKTAGVTVVVAAMNEARDAANVVPATYEEVITVSALADSDGRPGRLGGTTSAGGDDTLATFSNFGADINIAAPGVDILSTVPTGPCELCDPTGYTRLNGTSMAAPHVAGAAALYLAAHPGASPDQVKTHLLGTRERIALPGDPDGVAEGVLYVGGGTPPSPPPPSAGPGAGDETGTDKKKKKGKKHKKGKKGKKGKGRKR